jgi:hypothetical protein
MGGVREWESLSRERAVTNLSTASFQEDHKEILRDMTDDIGAVAMYHRLFTTVLV